MVLFNMYEFIEGADYSYWVVEYNEYAPEVVIQAYAKIFFKDTLPPQDEDCIAYFKRILLDTATLADIDWR